MINLLTQFAILNDATGKKKLVFAYDVVDSAGETQKSNQRKSFVVIDSEMQSLIEQLEAKVTDIMNAQ